MQKAEPAEWQEALPRVGGDEPVSVALVLAVLRTFTVRFARSALLAGCAAAAALALCLVIWLTSVAPARSLALAFGVLLLALVLLLGVTVWCGGVFAAASAGAVVMRRHRCATVLLEAALDVGDAAGAGLRARRVRERLSRADAAELSAALNQVGSLGGGGWLRRGSLGWAWRWMISRIVRTFVTILDVRLAAGGEIEIGTLPSILGGVVDRACAEVFERTALRATLVWAVAVGMLIAAMLAPSRT
jgi:hypothetical protein